MRGLSTEEVSAWMEEITLEETGWGTDSSNRYSIITGSLTDSTFALTGSSLGQINGTSSTSVMMGVTM